MNLQNFAESALSQAIAKLEAEGRMLRTSNYTFGKMVVINRPVFGKDKTTVLGYETTETELKTYKLFFQLPPNNFSTDYTYELREEIYKSIKNQEEEWKKEMKKFYPKRKKPCCYELCDWSWLTDWTNEGDDDIQVSADGRICLVKYCVILPEV